MHLRWLVLLNNLAGVSHIKLDKDQVRVSKISTIYNFTKFVVMLIVFTSLTPMFNFKRKIYKAEAMDLYTLSTFSKKVLEYSTHSLHTAAYGILLINLLRRGDICRFYESAIKFVLKDERNRRFKHRCVINTVFNVGFFMSMSIFRTFRLLNNDTILPYFVGCSTLQSHLGNLASFSFFCNFQHFIVLLLEEIEESIQEFSLRGARLRNVFAKLDEIENLLLNFEKVYGLQLTIITVTFTFSSVTFVSIFGGKIIKDLL